MLNQADDTNHTYTDYDCITDEEFKKFERNGEFITTGMSLLEERFGASRKLIESTAISGCGAVLELPLEAALSVIHSKKLQTLVTLVIPSENEYSAMLDACFKNDQHSLKQKFLDEYFETLKIHKENPGLFNAVVHPEDISSIVNYLYECLGGTDQDSVFSGQTNSSWSSMTETGIADGILPKESNERRQSLAIQARKKSVVRTTDRNFEIDPESTRRRTIMALSSITGEVSKSEKIVEGELETPRSQITRSTTQQSKRSVISSSVDWEAEGIVVLSDNARTLSERGISSCGYTESEAVSGRDNY